MTSVLNVDTIADKAGTGPVELTKQSAAKAWVNFDGTGTIAARDSLNISGLADNGTGDYTVTFSNALSNANYSSTMSCGQDSTGNSGLRAANGLSSTTRTTSVIRVGTATVSSSSNRTSIDDNTISLLIHGDLA
jgi:hypothetical protein